MDITYIPMARGLVYLAAIIDWHSRKVLAWDVSISTEADFCVRVLEAALARHGTPEIFKTDQGSQFTSLAFTERLKTASIAISMDGRGCWRDNVFSSGCGAASSTRRCTCAPTRPSARRAKASRGT